MTRERLRTKDYWYQHGVLEAARSKLPAKEKRVMQEMFQDVINILTRRPFAWKNPAALRVARDAISAEDAELLATGRMTVRAKAMIDRRIIGGMSREELSHEEISPFLRDAHDYVNTLMEILALPVVSVGRDVKQGGRDAHDSTYGTRDQRAAFIAALQRVVDTRHEEDPSRSFTKELCRFASDEVPQPWNGEHLEPDTIRHLVKNPKKK